MKHRKLNLKVLLIKTIVYRMIVLIIQIFFTYLFIKDFKKSISISLWWNGLNVIIYYVYDYGFLSIFKMGAEKCEK